MKKPKSPKTFEVTLRRDVQQMTRVRVQASTRKEAIAAARAVSADTDAWNIEEHIGVHKPEARELRE